MSRTESWNVAMGVSPGPLDLNIPASRVDGEIPTVLRGGSVLSNGPGWTSIGGRTAHPFDGHGYVRRFELLPEGGLRLRADFVRTPSYVAERDAGMLVHRGLATNTSPRFWQNVGFGGPVRNVANTTIVPWNGRLLAGWEAGSPYGVDPNDLSTLGEDDFGGLVAGQATLAHMRKDHAQGRLVLCSVKTGRESTFTFREVDASDQLVSSAVATLDGALFTHDYAMTPSWFLLGGNPLRVKPGTLAGALFGTTTFLEAVAPDERKPGVLHLVPRGGGALRSVALPEPAFVVHFGNAFERDGDVIVDACAFRHFEFGEEFGYSGPDRPFDPGLPEARGPQRLVRITVPADSATATWEPLTEHGVDFPRFHPEHEGVETPLLFGATRKDIRYSDPFDSVIGLDLLDRERPEQLWTAPEVVFVGEPLFAPDPEHPERGHVFAILSDGMKERSTLAIFDARDLASGPVASVELPLLPIAFHGDWMPPIG